MPSTSVIFDILARDRASDKFTKVGSSAEGAGSKLKSFGKVAALGAAGAAVGIGLFAKSAISAASDAQQSIGGTQAVFGKFSKTVIQHSRGAAQAYGLSANEFRESSNLIGSLLKNQGVAQDQLGQKTESLVKLGADLSATYGGKASDAVEALGAAFKGEFDPLEAFGVSLKQSTINTEAYALANVKGQSAFNKLTIAQQRAYTQQATMKLLMLQTKDAQGQFAKQTNTLAEQQQIAGAQFENLKAKIGSALLPVITTLFSFINNKGLPALSNLGTAFRQNVGPVLTSFGNMLKTTVVPAIQTFFTQLQTGQGVGGKVASSFKALASTLITVFTFISNNKATVGTFVGILGTVVAITKVWTTAQLALDFALSANPIGIVVVALAALAAGLVYAYKHSQTFRSIVVGSFQAIRAVAGAVAGFFTSTIPAAFNRVKSAASAALGWIRGNWPLILGVLTGPFGIAVALIARNWSSIVSGAKSAIGRVTSAMASLPGKILGAVGSLGSLLFNAGASVIQGLIDGIQSKIGAVTSKLHELTNLIPKHKGPLEKDRKLLHGAGQAIMDGLLAGLTSRWTKVKDFLSKITDRVKAAGDKLSGLISARNDMASSFASSFSTSIFGRDPGQDANGNAIPETVRGIKAFAAQQAQDAARLRANVQRLVSLGLSPDLLKQMQSTGASGRAQIDALATDASKSDIAYLNAQNKATQASLNAAGMSAANGAYGSDIAQAKRVAAEAAAIAKAVKDELHGALDGAVLATLKGDDIVLSIRRNRRIKGKADPFA